LSTTRPTDAAAEYAPAAGAGIEGAMFAIFITWAVIAFIGGIIIIFAVDAIMEWQRRH